MQKLFFLLGMLCWCTGKAQAPDNAHLLNVRLLAKDRAVVRATRDFWDRVGDGKHEEWYKREHGFIAEYADGPIEARFVYDEAGRWQYSVLTYGEKQMPEEVRKLVRSTYFDFSVTWVKEVHEGDIIAYVVHIENDRSWKEVSVVDGELSVLKSFYK